MKIVRNVKIALFCVLLMSLTNMNPKSEAREIPLPVRATESTILNPDGTVNGYKCLICDPKAWCFVVECGPLIPPPRE